jgi:hypothetical protein
VKDDAYLEGAAEAPWARCKFKRRIFEIEFLDPEQGRFDLRGERPLRYSDVESSRQIV